MINRLQLGYALKNPISTQMKTKYHLAYNMACIAADVVFEVYDIKVPEDEIAYITAYFGAYMLENKVSKRSYNIAIVCDAGRAMAILILGHLKLIFDKDATYKLYASNQVTSEELKSYDIIFTNCKLDIIVNLPVIEINDIFDDEEIKMKIKKETQLLKYKSKNTIKRAEISSVIASLLSDDKVFLLEETPHNYCF